MTTVPAAIPIFKFIPNSPVSPIKVATGIRFEGIDTNPALSERSMMNIMPRMVMSATERLEDKVSAQF